MPLPSSNSFPIHGGVPTRGTVLHDNKKSNIIVETDLFSDVDDAAALLIAAMHEKSNLLAVNLNHRSIYSALAVESILGYYGKTEVPIGVSDKADDAQRNELFFDDLNWCRGEFAGHIAYQGKQFHVPHASNGCGSATCVRCNKGSKWDDPSRFSLGKQAARQDIKDPQARENNNGQIASMRAEVLKDINLAKEEDLKMKVPWTKANPTDCQYDFPTPLKVYEDAISAAPANTVKIVSIGFLDNISELLTLRPDLAAKVKELVIMGAGFLPMERVSGDPALDPPRPSWNFLGLKDQTKLAAARNVISNWPGQITFLGNESGKDTKTGIRFMKYGPADDLVRKAYILYSGLEPRATWDPQAVLYAIDGVDKGPYLAEPLFEIAAKKGYLNLDDKGIHTWVTAASNKHHRYLRLCAGGVNAIAEKGKTNGEALDVLFMELAKKREVQVKSRAQIQAAKEARIQDLKTQLAYEEGSLGAVKHLVEGVQKVLRI